MPNTIVDNENGDNLDAQKNDDEIKTTSSMRSKIKGLETKERLKILLKRSMSEKEIKNIKKDLDNAIDEEYCPSPVKNGDMSPAKSIKHKLDKLNSMNNPLSKFIDDDVISVKSNKSRNSQDRQIINNKRSNMVRVLEDEVKKEKGAKNNALNILKSLKIKSKEVEHAILELSKN